MKCNLVFIIDSMGSGGAQRQLVNLLNKYSSMDVKCHLIILSDKHNFFLELLDKESHEILTTGQIKFIGKIYFIIKILKKLKYEDRKDIFLFPYLLKANLMSVLVKLFCPFKLRVFASERSSNRAYYKPAYFFIRYLYLLLSDAIIANSEAAQLEIQQLPGIRANKVFKIWNGYQINDVPNNNNIDYSDPVRLLYVARITPNKNLDKLINAIEESGCHTFSKDKIILDVVGRVESGSEQYFTEIQSKIKTSNFMSNIVTFHGEVANVDDFYKKCDAVILLSDYEGLPNVICEALLTGKLVMVTDISDMRLLMSPTTGVLISNLDTETIIGGLNRLRDLKRKIDCLETVEAFERVREQLSIDRNFYEFNKLIRSGL